MYLWWYRGKDKHSWAKKNFMNNDDALGTKQPRIMWKKIQTAEMIT